MTKRLIAGILLVFLGVCSVASGDDWLQFRGPNREGLSAETGLLKSWPDGGPKKLWESKEVGFGWASVSVVDGTVYTTGMMGKDIHVVALGPDGKRLWSRKIDRVTKAMGFSGARSTPTVDGDRLYAFSDGGTLACLDRTSGKVLWSRNVLKDYKAKNIRHSLAESPLVDGDRVFVTTGGKASLVAFDKASGKEVWAAKPVDAHAGYTSARIVEYKGLRQIVSVTEKVAYGVHAKTGAVLWTHPRETPWGVNINTPLFHDGVLYITSGYKIGTEALKLSVRGDKSGVTRLWNNPKMDDYFGGPVLMGKAILGTCHQQKHGLVALDAASGKQLYKNTKIDEASLLGADGRLYLGQYDGTVMLVDPATGRVISSFRVPFKKRKNTGTWAHLAISGGRLYFRHESTLSVYDIKAR